MKDVGDTGRATSFGAVADAYERYRPDYPAALVDAVLRRATRPVRSALEVGAGTGKATRVFASRGVGVRALEPDRAMLDVLRATTRGLPVEPVLGTFEGVPVEQDFDLVYAAASWHWVDPATRWTRAVELLAPGGVLALFGRPCDPIDPDVRAVIEQIERQVLPAAPAGHPWSMDDVARTPGLEDVVECDLPHTATIETAQLIGMLGTVSGYLTLSPEVRAAALARIRAALPERLEVDLTTRMCLAVRSGRGT